MVGFKPIPRNKTKAFVKRRTINRDFWSWMFLGSWATISSSPGCLSCTLGIYRRLRRKSNIRTSVWKENGALRGSRGDLWPISNYIRPATGEFLGRSWPNAGEWARCVPRTKLFVLNIFPRWRTKTGSWGVQSPLANQVIQTRSHLYPPNGPLLACWTIPSKLLE